MALNRIYKVVWSKTKGCYVVVSELAKRVGRNKAKAIVISSAAMAMAISPIFTSTTGATLNQPGTGDGNGVAWGENSTGTGSSAVAIGRDANASAYQSVAIGKGAISSNNSTVALGQDARATASGASALSVAATASGNNAVAIAYNSNASGTRATAIGEESNASSEDGIALGYKTRATSGSAVAIGREVVSSGDSAVALGKLSKATGRGSLALATEANATGNDSYAIGWRSDASAESTMAFGHSSKAKKNYDIAFGRGAEARDQGSGHSIAIGYGASAASNRGGLDSNTTSTGTLNSAGGVAIGTGAYTGINRGNTAINSSVAVGAGAGAGYRGLGADGLPTGNGTDPDDNATVLVKAFGGTTSTVDYFKNTGSANGDGFFSYQNVDINEATALGRNTRAIGDQSVAIGAQSIAGQGSIVIGGNDIQAYDGKKYFKAANPTSGAATTVNDFNAETTPGTGKNNQPITIRDKYAELVGAQLDNSYRASYGQDGSTVIGMQAHSTTPLGVAIGTNSIVRKGAFGATAIGSGASVLANAEAAVAIGMGSEAQGNYAVAAGTAARAKESAVAAGYKADAGVSAVSVGDESKAVQSSVAVGQLAQSLQVADIAIGQGAIAKGEQGAIAVGLGTQAQGDSSIMIGGSEITKVAAQPVEYQKEKKDKDGHTVIKTTTKVEHIGGEDVNRTIRSVEMEGANGTIQDAYGELTNGATLDTKTLNYSLPVNKNGHGSISMGIHSLSTGDLGTAIGTGARVTKLGGVALGTGAISELQNGVAIGTGSKADASSIGTRQTDISYDKEGKIVPFDSKKVAYTFYWAGGTNTSEGDVVSFGTPGAERQLKNVAAGRIADDSTDAINGSQLNSVTKRMSSGWAVEAEKDKDSSGVLKLNGAVATAGTEVYSEDGKTTDRVNKGTATGQVDKVRLNDEVKFRVGDNLVLHQQDGSRPVYEDPDNPNRKTGARVTSKFTYSLNPELTNLKSATFKNDAGDTTVINGNGVTVTPVTQGKEAVSLTTTGLNNGGNAISNVASNLPSTKNSDTATGPSNATTSQEAPNTTDKAGNNYVSPNNAATVGDVLNAGWNLQGNNTAVDFVKPYDTVNFIDGEGTTATVASTDGKISTVKYSVNLGDGLKKDDATNKIIVNAADKSLTVDTNGVKVNPADKSLEVTDAGLKVKTDGTTITTDNTNGLKVVTGEIESVTTGANPGTVKVKDNDAGKIATVDSVVNAVNSAAFTLKASATTGGIRNTGSSVTETGESIKAGSTVEMIAGKNLDVKHDTSGKITFATVDTPSFTTVQVGGDEGPKFSKTADGNISVSDKDGTNPVKITNVKDGDISENSNDAINGSQFHAVAKNTIKLAGQNGADTATETAAQDLDKKGGIKFTVKSSDGSLLEVAAEGDTITLTPKTGTITTTDGVPTATTTNGKLVTADEVVNALKEMGWKATAGNEGTGTVTGNATELIKAGNTVTFKAGDNLAVKQDGKNFIYSLNPALTGLTSAEFKDAKNNKVNITPEGITITKPADPTAGTPENTVTLNQNGLNNGGNAISNVKSNLPDTKNSDTANTEAAPSNATKVQAAPNTTNTTGDNYVNPNNAATVSDVLNAGWNLQGNNTAVDFVKPYDTVNFIDGDGTTATVASTDGKTSTVKYSVNLGNGLQKDDTGNTISVKPADSSLVVDGNGVKVNTGTINNVTTGDKAGTVEANTGDENKAATVGNVVNAINNAAWTATSAATSAGELGATAADQLVKSGDKVTFEADKNIKITQAGSKFTFATKDNVTFTTVQVGGDEGPKFSKTDAGDIKVSGSDNTAPVKITNVKDGDISENSNDAINGSQFHKLANNTIQLKGQTGDNAATETKKQELNKKDGIAFTIKSSDGSLLEVAAEGDTITLTPKTGTITTTDGVPTATTTNGKLVTADEVVNALKEMGWKATAGNEGTGTVTGNATELIKAGNTVTFKAGDNLAVKQDGKNFIYSLNPALTGLTSAEFKDAKNNKVNITPEGITITKPADPTAGTPENTVTLNQNGLNNGGNPITNVGGNLDGAKAGTDAPTTKHEAPNTTEATGPNYVNPNNAATVGDVLQAGWNLQNNGTEKDFVKPYDTVNFADGNGTTAVVETTENKKSTVKYNVNVGNGLEKNDTNQITVKPADSSLVVDAAGVKVNTGTINKVETGDKAGTVEANTGDTNKIATVGNVVEAINNAAFTLKTSATAEGTRNANSTVPETGELIKAGNTVELVAGKNLDVKHDTNSKITFATKENVSFETVQVGGDQGPKFSKSADGDIKVSGSDNAAPVKITNVKPGDISETSTDAINGSQFHGLAKNTIKLAGKTGDLEATETAAQDLDKKGGIKFTVKSSDGSLLEVAAEGDTITLTPKTGKITTGTDGVPTANTDGGKLVTADQLVTALTEMGWKATAGNEGTGTVTGNALELIKAGETVTFKAGDNLAVKQDGKNFIYSLKTELTGLTSAEFKDAKNNKVNITPEGITITKPADPTAGTPENTVTLNQNGLNNGGNAISNVKSNLPDTKNSDTANTEAAPSNATKVQAAPNTTNTTGDNYVNPNNAATVSDVLNAGWNLQGNNTAVDFVKPYDTVNFIDGDGTTATVASTDGKTSTVKYSVNLGNGLQKDDTGNTISVKPADSSLVVDGNGVKVNTGTINNVTTGDKTGTVTPNTGDDTKLATVTTVVNAINNAAWTATSAATAAGELGANATNQLVKAGDKVTFEADKNIKITQAGSQFTFATKDNVTFTTVQVGGDQGPKFSKTDTGDIKVSGSNDTDPVKITNVKDGDISENSNDAINGSQFHKLANNTIQLKGQTGDNAATETKKQELNKKDGIAFTIKSSDGSLLEVAAEGDTITLTPKTGKITTGTDGVPTANTDGGKLVTADQLVTALTEMGWKATAGNEGTGTVTGNATELIKAGNTVTFKAGDNLSIKQDGKNFIYSLKTELTGLTSAEFKDAKNNKVNITPEGITITKPADPTAGTPENTVTLNQNGLNNGGNAISNVKSNLPDTKNSDTANTEAAPSNATKVQAAPNTTNTTGDNYVNPNNAATVSDVLNAGWNLQGNNTAVDFVKPYDTVNFIDGDGTTATVASTDGKTSTVKYSVNLGNGLQKDDTGNTISVKPADSSLVVDGNGVKVNTGTINNVTTGDKPGTVEANTGDENKVATVGNVVSAINNAAWTATSGKTEAGELGKDATNQLVKAGDKVTFEADKNIKITQDGSKFTFATKDNVSFNTVQIGGDQGPKLSKTDDGDLKVSGPNGADPVKVTNVKSGLDKYGDQVNGADVPGTTDKNRGLVDLSKPENGQPKVSDNTAATVGDLRNMGWIVSSDKTTGADGSFTTDAYSAQVKHANEVKFVGTGTAIVSGTTDDKGVRTITVKVDDQTSTNKSVTPVVYTDENGKQVYPTGKVDQDGNQIFNTKPDGSGDTVTGPVKTTINGPKGTTTPTTLSNVEGNLDGAKTGTTAPTTNHAGVDTTNPAANNYVNPHNAATVGDVLNAGWNLQNNGTARDFVKPYDTVNFVNGVNTTAVVTTSDNGTTSNVTYNVTGLPMTYTDEAGNPVSKIGDKFYKVNDKGQPVDANGKPSTKVNNNGEPLDENGTVIQPINTATNPLHSTLVNPNVTNTADAPNKQTTSPTQLGNVTSGLNKYGDNIDGKPVAGTTTANTGLIDLSKPTNGDAPKVSDNTAATVGDLRNMGWIVSSDKKTDDLTKEYSDTVKNANEVKFVGEGTAIVSGKTDDKGVRTITVKVDDQTSTNNSVTPVNYTKKDGTKVYPKMVKNPDTGTEELKFFEKPDGSGNEVQKGDVITSINGPEGTTKPTTLSNVEGNLDGAKTGTTAPTTNAAAPTLGTANNQLNPHNAATVGDVLQAGWNLQNNGEARDFVKPYDTVNFINGLGTTAVVTTHEGNTTSDVTFNVKAANSSVTVDEDGVKVTTGEMKPAVDANNKETGAITIPADPATAKQLKDTLDAAVKELATAKDALKTAEKALEANPTDPALQKAVADKKADVAAKQTPVTEAQKAHDEAGLNKVATVQNVAEAINNAGFNLKTSADGGEKLTTGTKNDGELIRPSNTVEMVAGNNLTVKQDANGKITYATKDNVTFTNVDTGTLNVGSPNTYTDGKGNTYTKVGDKYYNPTDVVNGAPKQDVTPVTIPADVVVKPVSPVTMKTEAAKPATNNIIDAQPSSALNITSQDGKPTQITGVGSTLNTNVVKTTPEGTATKPGAAPGTTPKTEDVHLVDLNGTKDAPVNKNAAATVGDLQNMGWVVSTKDGNGYKDVVKNANVVDFKGAQGVTVTGTTLADGTREITIGVATGDVTNKVTITHADGTKTEAVKIGDNYYKVDENGKPVGFEKDKDGKPAGTPLTINPTTDSVTNKGAGFVTGNTVANAIQDSGWNIGKANGSDAVKSDGTAVDFNKEAKVYDKVNPNDDVKFVDGANTNVSMVTVDALNEDGTKKATTFVKVDINRDLKIDSVITGGTAVDKNGNNLVKVGEKYYKEGDVTVVTNPDGSTTVTPKKDAKPVPPADVIPPKDGAMIVKNADGKDVVSATVGKDGSGVFAVNGKDGKDGVSITAKDGQGAIGVNGKDGNNTSITGENISIKDKDNNSTSIGINNVTLKDKDGNISTLTADKSELKDKAGNTNTNTSTANILKDPNGNTNTSTASTSELKDKNGNTNTSTPTTNVLKDTNGNTNTSTAGGTTYTDRDANKTVVGPKEIAITDKSGDNKASLTKKDLILNAKDPKTGVDKTSHVSGDKIAFTTTDEIEKVVDKDGKPVIDPTTGKQKEVIKNPGNSTEYTNEGLKVIPNSIVARDANGNLTFLDKDGKPVSKDTDGNYKYVGQDGKPGEKYTGAVGSLKPNVADSTRVISFGMDKPVLDKDGNPVKGSDGKTVMTEGISAGMQQIHNVAPGTKDTDAVNVSQLRGTTININNRMNRMGAQAAALAGLQSIQYDPLEPTQISAGVGYYQGASALALGMNHYKNESTMFHVGASVNGNMNEVMANASVTWKFGARADETAVKDTFRQGPISASYTLQDKVSALEAQNRVQKEQLETLKALNEKQQEQIAELFKRLSEKA